MEGCSEIDSSCFYLYSWWFFNFSVGLLFQLSSSDLFKNISRHIRLYLELVNCHFHIMHHFIEICQLQVGVVATPDIHSFSLTERDKFIILGCDGLWGVFGASDAVEFVHKLLKEGLSVAAVTRRLVREAVRERNCKDNCTAVVIIFKRQ